MRILLLKAHLGLSCRQISLGLRGGGRGSLSQKNTLGVFYWCRETALGVSNPRWNWRWRWRDAQTVPSHEQPRQRLRPPSHEYAGPKYSVPKEKLHFVATDVA